MRDIVLTIFIFGAVPFVLRWPWVGILMWNWIGIMNPHRLTWSFAFNLPFAQVIGITTLIGAVFSREPKRFPLNAVTVTLLVFIVWMSITTLFALNADAALVQVQKVMKIQGGVLLGLLLLQTRERIQWLVWVIVLSIGFYGVKGGIFTLTTGGGQQVLGPDGSFISGNTEIGLALVMILPLMRYLQLTTERRWIRWALVGAMLLSGVAALGTQSRGAFLAAGAMVAFLWLKSEKKLVPGMVILVGAVLTLSFMPETWWAKMHTTLNYEQDGSAQGRLAAWQFAFNLAKDRPLVGGGFETFTHELYYLYFGPVTRNVDAHSIYFEVLGEHGFVGLALFLALAFATWRAGSQLIRLARESEQAWARQLGAMAQVSLIGYWTGGAFLGLAYFDGYYLIISLLVLALTVVKREGRVRAEMPTALLATTHASALDAPPRRT